MGARVIVVTSGKGGVGKTTTTANIGAGLAEKGHKVLLIDTDIGLRNLDVVMGLENRIVYDLVDVIEERCRISQALIKDKRCPNLVLLPAAQIRDKNDVSLEQMKNLVDSLKASFDYILIDCPAGIEQGFKNAIVAADEAIVVTTPEVSATRDADRIIGLLEATGIKDPKLIINRIRIDMVKDKNMLSVEDILDILAIKLLGVIPDDESVVISTNKGEPLVYKGDSLAAKAFKNIASRLEGIDVPLLDLDTKMSFLDKIKFVLRGDGMLGMITNLFKKENSKDDAKNRLKLVLIQDRAMLPSGVLENMKDDILKVLSKYVEIEKSKLNIEVCPYDEDPRKIALVANIPIVSPANRRK